MEPVKHGYWVQLDVWDKKVKENYTHVICPVCINIVACGWKHSFQIRTALNYKYCPYCGAKMDSIKKE